MAGFIGSANLLPGRGQRRLAVAGRRARSGHGLDDRRRRRPATLAPATDVTVMLRPERLDAARAASRSTAAPSSATIKEVIYQGSEIRLIVDLDDRHRDHRRRSTPTTATELTRPGNLVTLTWAPERAVRAAGPHRDRRCHQHRLRRGRGDDGGQALDADGDVRPMTAGRPTTAGTMSTGRRVPDRRRRRRPPARSARSLLSSVGGSDGGAGPTVVTGDERRRRRRHRAGRRRSSTSSTGPSTSTSTEDGETGTDRPVPATRPGISVNYSETWNDNNEAYGKEFVAYLEAGNPTPWDIAVPTYWMAARLKAQGLAGTAPVQPHPELREPRARSTSTSPGTRARKFNLPWQAGFTGFAYNIAETGRELQSINELFDPEFAGKIGFFTEMRDTLGLVMLGQGNDPANPTEDTINAGARHDRAGQERRPDPPLHRQRLPPGHRERELRRLHRVVRRHRPVVEPRRAVRLPRGGGDVVVRHDGDPDRARPTASPRRSS